jgi:hypothetical protein
VEEVPARWHHAHQLVVHLGILRLAEHALALPRHRLHDSLRVQHERRFVDRALHIGGRRAAGAGGGLARATMSTAMATTSRSSATLGLMSSLLDRSFARQCVWLLPFRLTR